MLVYAGVVEEVPVASAAVLSLLPPCPGCAGGGTVNGLECRDCGGSTRAGKMPRRRWRPSLSPVIGPLATVAGWVTGRVLASLPTVPGIAGAVMVSLSAGELAGHLFGHGLTPWVGVAVGGVFALLLDRRIP